VSTTETFEQYRPLLFGLAYQMLGSVMAAEDLVQESFLRWQGVNQEEVSHPKAYLFTVLTHLCLDTLRSASVQREEYVGPWLPEPLVRARAPDVSDNVALADTLSTAFLLLLQRLSPVERAVFLLHDIFDYGFSDVARIVGKSEANCRQIARRARQQLAAQRPRFHPSSEEQARMVQQFVQTCATGDMSSLVNLLAEDVTLYSDGGGKTAAALKPIHGPEKVARFLFAILAKAPLGLELRFEEVNGQVGLIIYDGPRPYSVFTFDVAGERIQAIYTVVNPDKLQGVPPHAG
jgi:RNA polymerase sigma-70 factor (ECF subfamily)